MKKSEATVMYDAPEAATYRTDIKGWVSRGGRYFGDGEHGEHLARHDGCTHLPCSSCGEPMRASGYCLRCWNERRAERYQAMPRARWDGAAMLYSDAHDEYYTDLDHAEEYLANLDDGLMLADLRLVICVPEYVRQLDPGDFADDMPDDTDLPDEVYAAIEAFNEAVAGIQISWRPGKYALDLGDGGDQ